MSRPLKILSMFFLAIIICVFWIGEAGAAVTAFVARDGVDRYYQYNYDDLLESYVISILEGEGELYRHYSRRRTAAMVDDAKGYVDYSDILEAYAVAVITGKSFDLDTYIAEEGKPLELPPTLVKVAEDEGKLVEEELWVAKQPEDNFLEKVEASEEGPLPVLSRVVRWQPLMDEEGEEEDLKYIWYIYRDNQHVRTIWYGDNEYLDYVPTDPGTFQVRAFALCPEGYAHEAFSEELVMEETVVIEKPDWIFASPRG